MQRLKYFFMSIIIIICFLCIQISYNGTPSVSIFSSLIAIIYESIDKGWNFSLDNWTMNFNFLLVEFLVVSSFLLISSKLNNIRLIKWSLSLFVILWLFWALTYKPYIEIKLYMLTSIPFLATCIFMGILIFIKSNRVQ